MKLTITFLSLIIVFKGYCQVSPNTDSLRKVYYSGMKSISARFNRDYYPNRPAIYAQHEKEFLKKVDSLKYPFVQELAKYKKLNGEKDAAFVASEKRDIDYYFDRIILDYPYFHEFHTDQPTELSPTVRKKLDQHQTDFNRPELLKSGDVRGYIEAFLRHASTKELKKPAYTLSDNKRLDAYLNLTPRYFTNPACRDYWQYYYLKDHLDECGGKNMDGVVKKFLASCKNAEYRHEIDSMYTESIHARSNHLVTNYKSIDGYNLEMHLFLPDPAATGSRPVMVFFSGGSWTKGSPEWAFYSCTELAKKGWVAASVEYRLADRHETTPFEAVKDARSAIRWLRMNAAKYKIDTSRIVVSGNSAGGHLALTTAMADDWNESTDNLNYSASPNLLLINAGVYSLYAEGATDWITRGLKDKSIAKKISPQHLLRKGLPPMLIIHGTNDQSVDYATAKLFAQAMEQLGNDFEFQTLEGAPHYIWFDQRYSGKVAQIRAAFLKKHGYE